MISHLSNSELEQRLFYLVKKERELLHVILEHIVEVDRRKLYLEKAYSSLYEYLVQECRYSGSAAMRRINAARLMRELPEVSKEIQAGKINLSQISEVSRAIKQKEKESKVQVPLEKKSEIMQSIAGKSIKASQQQISKKLDLELKPAEAKFVQKDDSIYLSTTVSSEQQKLYEVIRDLEASTLLSEYKDLSMMTVFEFLAKKHLKSLKLEDLMNKDPEDQSVGLSEKNKKPEPNKNNLNRQLNESHHPRSLENEEGPLSPSTQLNQPGSNSLEKALEVLSPDGSAELSKKAHLKWPPKKHNKTLTPNTRRRVLRQDKCCQFKDFKTGKVCGSRFNLQVDHKQSQWAQGSHDTENLQMLCQAHNNYKYRQEAQIRLF